MITLFISLYFIFYKGQKQSILIFGSFCKTVIKFSLKKINDS